MKRIVFILVLLTAVDFLAQDNNKGNISLTFNGEEINLPVTAVKMEKTGSILLSARAEKNDEDIQQIIALDITLAELDLENGEPLRSDNFRLEVKMRKLIEKGNYHEGKDFLLSFVEGAQACRFSIYSGNERVDWQMLSMVLRMYITEINFIDNHLKITGEVSVTLRSALDSFYANEVAKIENGRFEIIL
ncbi:MAG: hypothetical protein K9N07_09630 [Candidatus Cloacimonetes bacterium]|nr:hypothetical protein [Candidatus Cloacimonadota bacterium]